MFDERFFWGAPRSTDQVAAYKKAVLDRKTENAGELEVVSRLDTAIDRVTDKSAGLLQADSILAAIATLFSYQATWLAPWAILLSKAVLAMALLSGLLLAFNLAVIWAKTPQTTYATASATIDFQLKIYRARAVRFTAALVLSLLAFLGTLVAVVLSSLLAP